MRVNNFVSSEIYHRFNWENKNKR